MWALYARDLVVTPMFVRGHLIDFDKSSTNRYVLAVEILDISQFSWNQHV